MAPSLNVADKWGSDNMHDLIPKHSSISIKPVSNIFNQIDFILLQRQMCRFSLVMFINCNGKCFKVEELDNNIPAKASKIQKEQRQEV